MTIPQLTKDSDRQESAKLRGFSIIGAIGSVKLQSVWELSLSIWLSYRDRSRANSCRFVSWYS